MSARVRPAGAHQRKDIQGLRAIAVLLVVAEHFFLVPAGGFIGVDVFFVISGFLITGLLLREWGRSGRISLADFYRRRIRRIMPAAVLTILVTVISARFVFNAGRVGGVTVDGVWAALSLANWRFAWSGTDYFAATAPPSPLQHFWSLAVEEQFYLIWPVLLILAGILAARLPTRLRECARTVVPLVLVALGTVASFGWATFESAANPTFAYFSTFSRAWELGVGAVLAILTVRAPALPVFVRVSLAWLGLAGIAASALLIRGGEGFPAPWALLPVMATAAVLASGIGGAQTYTGVLTVRPMTYVGDISYSLYLWHFPVLIVAGPVLAHVGAAPDSPQYGVILIVAFFGLAIASYHFVEEPIRRSHWLVPRTLSRRSRRLPHALVAATAVATVAVVIVSFSVDRSVSAAGSSPGAGSIALPTASAAGGDASAAGAAQTALAAAIESSLEATEWPSDLQPTLESVGEEVLPGLTAKCGGAALPTDPAACTFGDASAPHTAVLVGDSIAQAYVPALVSIFGTGEWKLRITSMYACPFIAKDVGDQEGRIDVCRSRKDQEAAIVKEVQPDLLIIGNTYWRSTDPDTGQKVTIDVWNRAFTTQLDTVKDSARAVLALPPPAPDKDISACMTAFSTPADCVSSVADTDWADMANGQRAAIAAIGGTFIDNRAWFCDSEGKCPAFVGSVLMKKDQAHITARYAEFIAPAMKESIDASGVLAPFAATP